VRKYEGLFILNTAGKDESVPDVIKKIETEIAATGGRVETVQKMDRRPFVRITDKKVPSGYFVNFIFDAPATAIKALRNKFSLNEEVYRVSFTTAPAPKPAK
jgi:ribosomal protein S6